ncbi:uncharacterized protein [Coffea arabica]|uniref:Uncharacterized protein n=1 Tax=Coffea arabica TaxID=13443 RepID=A0ABM4UII8_COFAR
MSRVGQVIRCKYCLQQGHNVRSCKLKKDENNASGSGIKSKEAAYNTRSDEVDSEDYDEVNCTEILVTCTPQIFDKNPNNKSAKLAKSPHAESRVQDGSMHDVTKLATSTETNHLEDVAVTSSAPTSHDLYEVFGLKRAQVKYSQPVHGTKEKEHVQMPVKTKSVHREVVAAAATKRVVGSSRMKGKNKVL